MHLPRPRVVRHDFLDEQAEPQRVLVVVFLRGGADGLTLVPPVGDDAYHRARPTLAVDASSSIDLDGYFGLNRQLEPLMSLVDDGRLGIVHGAGSEDGSRSHFEAQDTMEHGGESLGSGWLARYLRARGPDLSALAAVSIGTTRPESLRGAPAGAVLQTLRDFDVGGDDETLVEHLEQLYELHAGPLGAAGRQTIDAVRRLRELRAEAALAPDRGSYPDTNFGRGLREIARLIRADLGLVASTIDLSGWDTHFVQSTVIGSLMRDLAQGVDAFVEDLGEDAQRVDLVVMTEFGRRLRENSSFGTDHGAGSSLFVVGEAAEDLGLGGRVQSGWPDLTDANLDEVGDVPSAINYRDVLAPILARHHAGLDLARVFPGVASQPGWPGSSGGIGQSS